MKKLKFLLFLALLVPTLSMACGSLDYWAKKYLEGSEDKKTMLYRMTKCLEYYPSQAKESEIIYEVFSDAVYDEVLLENEDAQKYLKILFYKSECLVGHIGLEGYEDVKQKFGRECTSK